MEAKLQEDDELTSVEIQRLLSRKFSISISAPTTYMKICMDAPEVGSCLHKIWANDFR